MKRIKRRTQFFDPDKSLAESQLERDWSNYTERCLEDRLFFEQQQCRLKRSKQKNQSVANHASNETCWYHDKFEEYILNLSFQMNQEPLQFQPIK